MAVIKKFEAVKISQNHLLGIQDLSISEVSNLIGGVAGVQTLENIMFNNVHGTSSGYSQYKYGFDRATSKGVIYPSLDPSIFELKFPNTDINGRVITY